LTINYVLSLIGTNLQALLDYTLSNAHKSAANIVLVISNVAGAYGLERASKAGVKTLMINHKEFKTRQDFDAALHDKLTQDNIDIICLAGFMRILSGEFVEKWPGRILNVHPALLPSFKGAHAHRLVLESGVRITGCTVHFVTEAVDDGAILVQEAVPVMSNDTEETLSERVKLAEHRIFPEALELLASGTVALGDNGKLVWK
jgi:phosphoribosylamine--glycine ligase/phosphoribosylglycinamide formyltransferase/phosphoribosylformylglycinamidine cyclo-ligase